MGIFKGWGGPTSPYRFKRNLGIPFLNIGVYNDAFLGTEPGAGHSYLVDRAGMGGVPVKRQMFPAKNHTVITGGPGNAAIAPLGGLTGGLYHAGQLTLTALTQYQQQQAYNGGPGTPPPPVGSFAGG